MTFVSELSSLHHGRTQVIAINFSEKSSFSLDLSNSELQSGEQWQLRGQPHANTIFFNDAPLLYDARSGGLPSMTGRVVYDMQLPPCSVTFVEFASAASPVHL